MRNTMEMTLSSHCPAEHQEDHCRQTEKLFSEYLVRRVSDQVLEQIGNADPEVRSFLLECELENSGNRDFFEGLER